MSKLKIAAGEELDVGTANRWRYKVGRTVGGLFYVCRRSLFFGCHRRRIERVAVRDTVLQAVKAAREHMAACERGVRDYCARSPKKYFRLGLGRWHR